MDFVARGEARRVERTATAPLEGADTQEVLGHGSTNALHVPADACRRRPDLDFPVEMWISAWVVLV